MQSSVELVGAIVDALNRGDVDGMLARMHPDFEWRPLEASPVARAGFCQVWTVRDGAAVAMEEHSGREQGEAAARR